MRAVRTRGGSRQGVCHRHVLPACRVEVDSPRPRSFIAAVGLARSRRHRRGGASRGRLDWPCPRLGAPGDVRRLVNWFHFAFDRLDDLPELRVSGHERAYLTWLFQNKAVRTTAAFARPRWTSMCAPSGSQVPHIRASNTIVRHFRPPGWRGRGSASLLSCRCPCSFRCGPTSDRHGR